MDNLKLIMVICAAVGFFLGWLGSDILALIRLRNPKLPKDYESKKE